MPRGRGGARTGTPGKSYQNRTDLNGATAQPVAAGPSKSYGSQSAQLAAQQAIPLPAQPGMAGPLDRPSERPGEPVTSGLSTGPGAGPQSLGAAGPAADALYDLQRVYQMFPDDNLFALIDEFRRELGMR